jgi:hypothetical protein
MTSIVWLALAVILVGFVALLGLGPKGGKPVARTRLMSAARVILIGAVIVCGGMGVFGALMH